MSKGEQRSVMLAGPSFAAGPPSSSCDLGAGRGSGAVLGMERHLWPLSASSTSSFWLLKVFSDRARCPGRRGPCGKLRFTVHSFMKASRQHPKATCPPLRWCHFHAAPCALHPTGPAGSQEPGLVQGRLCPLLLPERFLPHCLPEPCCRAWDLCRLPWRR